jgi:hypothetical protein
MSSEYSLLYYMYTVCALINHCYLTIRCLSHYRCLSLSGTDRGRTLTLINHCCLPVFVFLSGTDRGRWSEAAPLLEEAVRLGHPTAAQHVAMFQRRAGEEIPAVD